MSVSPFNSPAAPANPFLSPVTPINPQVRYIGSPMLLKAPRMIRQTRLNFAPSIIDQRENVVPQEDASPEKLIDLYAADIKSHLERRLTIFYHQLVTCHGTGLHLDIGSTPEQAESGRPLYVQVGAERRKLCARNAAHSSTLPNLIAYEGSAWKKYLADFESDLNIDKPPGFVFMKESAIYLAANATIEMPWDVNKADMYVDGSPHAWRARAMAIDSAPNTRGLRLHALKLLNQASQGLIDPQKGLRLFVEVLQEKVQSVLRADLKPGVQRTLEYYQEQAAEIQQQIESDPTFFDTLLNVNMDDAENAADLRPTIHAARFRAIRHHHLAQVQTTREIRSLQKSLFKRRPVKGAPYGQEVFQERLIASMPTKRDQIRVKKVLGHRKIDDRRFGKGQLTRLHKTRVLLRRYTPKFDAAAQRISQEFENARKHEFETRGRVIRKLRAAQQWSEADLVDRLRTAFPEKAFTVEDLSVIESGRVAVSDDQATMMCSIFKVDSTIFFPNFFYT